MSRVGIIRLVNRLITSIHVVVGNEVVRGISAYRDARSTGGRGWVLNMKTVDLDMGTDREAADENRISWINRDGLVVACASCAHVHVLVVRSCKNRARIAGRHGTGAGLNTAKVPTTA